MASGRPLIRWPYGFYIFVWGVHYGNGFSCLRLDIYCSQMEKSSESKFENACVFISCFSTWKRKLIGNKNLDVSFLWREKKKAPKDLFNYFRIDQARASICSKFSISPKHDFNYIALDLWRFFCQKCTIFFRFSLQAFRLEKCSENVK